MLEICQNRIKEAGYSARCEFHHGYVETFPETQRFDGATSILVSQFILDDKDRRNFFRQIFQRINPKGILISADLSSDVSSSLYQNLLKIWARTWSYCEMSNEETEQLRKALNEGMAIVPPKEIESIIQSAGFEKPVLFFQSLFIHSWFAEKP